MKFAVASWDSVEKRLYLERIHLPEPAVGAPPSPVDKRVLAVRASMHYAHLISTHVLGPDALVRLDEIADFDTFQKAYRASGDMEVAVMDIE